MLRLALHRPVATSVPSRTFAVQPKLLALSNLRDNSGARKIEKRIGRGPGSGLGKTAGRGHKGSWARQGRVSHPFFEGGQTPLFRRIPKRGFVNPFKIEHEIVNLYKLSWWINAGRIDPSKPIDQKVLRDSGLVRQIKEGVKLLGDGAADWKLPVHLEVADCAKSAREAIEKAGGSVKLVYHNRRGLRAHLNPEKFEFQPKPAYPPPRRAAKYGLEPRI